MQYRVGEEDVVLAAGIRWIHTEGIGLADVPDVDIAQHTVVAREAETPVPLLTHDLDVHCVVWNCDELAPDHEAGREHRGYADRSNHGKPSLEIGVLRVVVCLPPRLMPEAEHAVGQEKIDRNEHDARDN